VPSEEKVDNRFRGRADAHIHLANEQCSEADAGEVSASLLYAASRFNAYVVASLAPDAKTLRSRRQEAVDYFSDQFRQMFEDNIDDYIKHHKKYTKDV
jgi:hypothetical protein